jgi:hypothetical protein
VNHVLPEMLFFVGDVRDPSGIAANSDKITAEIMNTMHALRRIITPTPKDSFLKAGQPPAGASREDLKNLEDTTMKQFQDLRKFALEEVHRFVVPMDAGFPF